MKKGIITFTHTNYLIKSAGTEKYIRNISKNIQSQNMHHLCFFTFYDDSNRMKEKKIGVIFNDCFEGIYLYKNLINIINHYSFAYEIEYVSIQLQQLINHDLEIISKTIIDLDLPVYILLHDYYLVCNQLKLINSDNEFCGIEIPSIKKCRNCVYCKEALEHSKKILSFIETIENNIACFVSPSEYVAEHIKEVFPKYINKITVRHHTISDGNKEYNKINKIKLAYVGTQSEEKGYAIWKKMLEYIDDSKIELFYLGIGQEKLEKVNNIFVSNAKQGDNAMVEALRENDINCVFMWPIWAETYSYVYYEVAMSGAFILSNKISGNICSEIINNQNGKCFDSFEVCKNYVLHTDELMKDINNFRESGIYHPISCKNNNNLDVYLENQGSYFNLKKTKLAKDFLLTLLYRLKYKDIL